MFWSKVECDGCHRKVRKSELAYYRGNNFCGEACKSTWVAENPPLVAKGDRLKLRDDLLQLIVAAMREWQTLGGRVSPDLFTVAARVARIAIGEAKFLGGIDARQQAEIRQGAKMRFIQHACETIPLLNALGYEREANALQSFDFGNATSLRPVAAALESAHARAAQA